MISCVRTHRPRICAAVGVADPALAAADSGGSATESERPLSMILVLVPGRITELKSLFTWGISSRQARIYLTSSMIAFPTARVRARLSCQELLGRGMAFDDLLGRTISFSTDATFGLRFVDATSGAGADRAATQLGHKPERHPCSPEVYS